MSMLVFTLDSRESNGTGSQLGRITLVDGFFGKDDWYGATTPNMEHLIGKAKTRDIHFFQWNLRGICKLLWKFLIDVALSVYYNCLLAGIKCFIVIFQMKYSCGICVWYEGQRTITSKISI